MNDVEGQPGNPFEIPPGKVGDYARALNTSPFKDSQLLRQATGYIEAGRYGDAVPEIQRELQKRGVSFELIPKASNADGTVLNADGTAIFRLEDDYPHSSASKQLFSLLHRNMSLILRRSGLRYTHDLQVDLVKMDAAYVAALKRTAENERDQAKKSQLSRDAFSLELETVRKSRVLGKSKDPLR